MNCFFGNFEVGDGPVLVGDWKRRTSGLELARMKRLNDLLIVRMGVAATAVMIALLACSAFAFGKSQTELRICGRPSGDGLISVQDSIDEIGVNVSGSLANGLSELSTLPNVQALIRLIDPQKSCLTAIVISKNEYQYQKILAVLQLQAKDGKTWSLPMIFQTASIQALENMYAKPWVGFARRDLGAAIREALTKVEWVQGNNVPTSPADSLSSLFPSSTLPIESGSQSYVLIPDLDPEWSTYLVSQMRLIDTGNPFTSTELTEAGVVQWSRKNAQVRMAPLTGFFDIASRLEGLQTSVAPLNSSVDVQIATLRGLATP